MIKLTTLAVVAILALGTTSLMGDSEVNTNDNININLMLDSEISGSTVGTQIRLDKLFQQTYFFFPSTCTLIIFKSTFFRHNK